MYSINVFVTFSLSQLGDVPLLVARARRSRRTGGARSRSTWSPGALPVGILAVTVYEKFREGGWVTIVVTGVAGRALLR